MEGNWNFSESVSGADMSYKDDIRSTRVGCLGSSDGVMLSRVAMMGSVPRSFHHRLAVCKGLVPVSEIPRTAAIYAGDAVEYGLFSMLHAKDSRYVSNPLLVSQRYSRPNCKLISHPDIMLADTDNKILWLYEVKATVDDVKATRYAYRAQLFLHGLIGREYAATLGKGWRVRVVLAHYSTRGLDLSLGLDFDVSRLTLNDVRYVQVFDVGKAMDITDAFLEGMTEYYEGDDVDASLLPDAVRNEFDAVSLALREIKQREDMVKDFKVKLYDFMSSRDIRSISGDGFRVTCVAPSEAHGFDSRRYLEDYQRDHKRLYKKLVAKYDKVSKRNGYVKIDVKEQNN